MPAARILPLVFTKKQLKLIDFDVYVHQYRSRFLFCKYSEQERELYSLANTKVTETVQGRLVYYRLTPPFITDDTKTMGNKFRMSVWPSKHTHDAFYFGTVYNFFFIAKTTTTTTRHVV